MESGGLSAWLQAPQADAGFLRLFVLATWWVGAIAGVALVWKAGGKVFDLCCGILSGAVLGLGAFATVGCLLVLGDALPRLLLAPLQGSQAMRSAGLATPLWLFTAIFCWAGLGGGIGLVLGLMGSTGTAVLAALARPLVGLFRVAGLERAANFFALRGG
jgi:hypothetical protein